METEKWIESLAAQARREETPELDVHAPRAAELRGSIGMIGAMSVRATPKTLWFSGVAALMAACLMLAVGVYQQERSTSTATNSNDSMSVLFSPLNMN